MTKKNYTVRVQGQGGKSEGGNLMLPYHNRF